MGNHSVSNQGIREKEKMTEASRQGAAAVSA